MNKMSKDSREQALHALTKLLRRPRAGTGLDAAGLDTALGAAGDLELAAGDHAPVDPRAAERLEVKACDDVDAPHDITALKRGDLSPEEALRLARHVKRCETCRVLVGGFFRELGPVESTGTHRPAPVAAAERVAAGQRAAPAAPAARAVPAARRQARR